MSFQLCVLGQALHKHEVFLKISPFDQMGHPWKFVLGAASSLPHRSHCSWKSGLNDGSLLWSHLVLRYRVEVQVLENSVVSISKPLFICFPDLGI